jgi:NAD(P)-dependent dehydrogenase (short-subunit alcohol dehydrogenase family)
MFRLDKKVIVLTGAARGLGAAAAKVLAGQGAELALVDVRADEVRAVAEKIGGNVRVYAADLGDVESIRRLTAQLEQDFGRIDVLINNAAICPRTSFLETTVEEWQRIMTINALGPFFLMQAVCSVMRRTGGGKIINVISASGQFGAMAQASVYSASKGAMIAFSKSAAKELARDHITVNMFSPGTMATDQINCLSEEKRKEIAERSIPLGRLTTPEEMAPPLAFMCSDECSFTTGATFDFIGGLCMR